MSVFVRKLAGSMHPPTRKYSTEISPFLSYTTSTPGPSQQVASPMLTPATPTLTTSTSSSR